MNLLKRTSSDPNTAAATLLEAQARATEQRIAAERLLEHARVLEERLRLEAAVEGARGAEAELEAALVRQRAERERLEGELRECAAHGPPIDAVEELSVLEARLGLSAEAAKRVAERRAADAARHAQRAD